ncbi:MAG: GNAT family protein [Pseudomonadota bacterium]
MALTVREMAPEELDLRIDYFLNASADYLRTLGVAPDLLAPREKWRADCREEMARPITERRILFLIWLAGDDPVGFSTADHITFGVEAKMHLHVLRPEDRRQGVGLAGAKASAAYYFDRLKVQRLICEPNAFNTGPHRTLQRAGFTFEKTYVTTPGPINFEQPVTRWVLERGAAGSLVEN